MAPDGGVPHTFPPPLERAWPVLNGRVQTRSLEAHVVDHCNLSCAGCCSLSPALPPRFTRPEDLARDLDLAKKTVAPRVFKLVGGEPLLHPEVVALARVARRSGVAPEVSLTTHGFLLERAPDALFDALDALTVSLYPRPALPEDAIAHITARARAHGVRLNWKRQDHFVTMDRAARCEDPEENRRVWDRCWLRERCHLVRDGYFYACTRPVHFGSYHGAAFDPRGDGVPLEPTDSALPRVLAYLSRPEPLAACALCLGGDAPLAPHRLLSRAELLALRGGRG